MTTVATKSVDNFALHHIYTIITTLYGGSERSITGKARIQITQSSSQTSIKLQVWDYNGPMRWETLYDTMDFGAKMVEEALEKAKISIGTDAYCIVNDIGEQCGEVISREKGRFGGWNAILFYVDDFLKSVRSHYCLVPLAIE